MNLTKTIVAAALIPFVAGCMDQDTVESSTNDTATKTETAAKTTSTRAAATSDVFEVRPSGGFIISEGSFGKYGELITVLQARRISGQTAVCGAGYLTDPSGRKLFKQMMRDVDFTINGRSLIRRLDFIKMTTGGFDRNGMLNCRFVDTPWQDGFEKSSNWSTRLRGSGRYAL